ncbi:Oligopeptide-binding protein AppA precursor [Roseovarius albus]|uniref:Oligopeptide-binding protein AppA n=1 Tax=Roseovarius albus TaxID=1247867 RepID=A0A1X6Y6G9_9RHOB|nr:ABC transporter substrate-binding protein [Roseovarius albus]SLN11805.1 Oligopeptide-binding protein AppA precursor [Roseovarius albus]
MTPSFTRRGFLKSTAATAMAASVPFAPAAAAPKRGGHFRAGMAAGQTTDTLNPGTWDNSFTVSMAYAVHGYLTEVAADGSLKPLLAESWEAADGAATWHLKIRDGVAYHSGQTVTAEDVVASLNFHRGETSTSAAKPLLAPVVDISIEGGNTVVIKLDAGNADFPFILSDYHMPICKIEGNSIDWKSGDGCGSYVLKNFSPGVSATLERNPNHWKSDIAFFDSIELLTLLDLNARTTAMISGDVDAIDRLDLKTVALLGRKPGVQINSVAGNQHYTFAMNAGMDPFSENHVRMALKHAINREELVEKILFGYGSVGNDHPIGSGQRFFNSELAQTPYDPDKAKWHLSQAGIDGLDISLSAADAAFGGAVDAAVLFQNSAKPAGIQIDAIREPNDGYWSDVWMKKPFTTVYWSGRPTEDQMFSLTYQCGAAWNDGFWCNERFDKLLIKARSELDETKRREMYYEMQTTLNQNGSTVIPMFANFVFANTDKVGHPEQLGSNWDLDGQRWLERWWFV